MMHGQKNIKLSKYVLYVLYVHRPIEEMTKNKLLFKQQDLRYSLT